jgi:hypothetical protein
MNKSSKTRQNATDLEARDERQKKGTDKAESDEKKKEAAKPLYLDRYE